MVSERQDFTVVTKLKKHFKSLYGFGGCCLNITDVCMDFEPCFKVHNLVSVYPKSIKLRQMKHLNVFVHVVVPDYRLAKLWNSTQVLAHFRNGQYLFTKFEVLLSLTILAESCHGQYLLISWSVQSETSSSWYSRLVYTTLVSFAIYVYSDWLPISDYETISIFPGSR